MTPAAGQHWLLTWSPQRTLFVIIAAVVVVLDQCSKYWAVGALTYALDPRGGAPLSFVERLSRFWGTEHPARSQAITVHASFWRFLYAENPGAAFSFLAWGEGWNVWLFTTMTLLACVLIVRYHASTRPEQHLARVALALVFGGAVGNNIIDRPRLGYVIDFVQWHWYDRFHWPVFNVADVAISVGVGLLILDLLRQRPAEAAAATPTRAP